MHSSLEETEKLMFFGATTKKAWSKPVLNSAAADCHRLFFVVNSVKFHLTASESWLTYFVIQLVDTHPV